MPPSDKNLKKRVSHGLTRLLRHTVDKRNIDRDEIGGVRISIILSLPEYRSPDINLELLEQIVANSDKMRFDMYQDKNENTRIRATQGHTFMIDINHALTEITLVDDATTGEFSVSPRINLDEITHGTYYKALDDIKKSGLNRMNRIHIHAGQGMPEDGETISGMRSSCEVVIYINVVAALKAGYYRFYLSKNGVVLTPGDEDGYLDPRFFSKIVDRKSGNLISF
jgi:2'-phosphotransferase